MDEYHFLRRSSSATYICRETDNLHTFNNKIPKSRSIENFRCLDLSSADPYKPRQSFSLPFVRPNYPFLICRQHISHCDYSRNRAYNPFAGRYRTPQYNGYFCGTRHWYDNYNYPHLRKRWAPSYPYIHWTEPPHTPYYSSFIPYNSNFSYYRLFNA
uniref:Uncharacterized protein n=1 Tax=Ditylenchus dipsaci TaxID=166011 RepID=A0A915CPZ3_9BILA